jgi:hypothetical protein
MSGNAAKKISKAMLGGRTLPYTADDASFGLYRPRQG